MRVGPFEFSMRELGGALGDFGTLLPLTVGYIAVCGMDPCGLLVGMGVANIATGLVYRLPMPIEPMKVLAVAAIAGRWQPQQVRTAGLAMGGIWVLMAVSGAMDRVARMTPRAVVRGIQISLGLLLAGHGLRMMSSAWVLGLAAAALAVLLRRSSYAPAPVVLVALGVVLLALRDQLPPLGPALGFSLPTPGGIDVRSLWPVLRDGGLAQIPLTATNAVIATSALIAEYWPGRRVPPGALALNMGVMNCALPLLGGMPLCHGAGGLASQYYFGARTGGANLIEGLIEVSMGLFLAGGIAALFVAFPHAIVGAMMLLVGVELLKFVRDLPRDRSALPAVVTVALSLALNMAAGFALGLACHYALRPRRPRGRSES